MNRHLGLLAASLLTSATVILATVPLASPATAATTSVTGRRIVLDPGHGGSDPGSTQCATMPEKEATLDIARRLRDLLVADGATVYLTRETDVTKSNNDRYTYANSVNGEVLVSVHLNGSTDHSKNGTLGLWGKKTKDLKFTQVLHQRLASELGVPDEGVTNFASGVLLKSNMPATIQETVYISNTQECQQLTDGKNSGTYTRQQQIAQSLANGIKDWFAR